MRKAWTFLILGIWVAILPYSGFPNSWKNILFTISGLILACLGFFMVKKEKAERNPGNTFDNFRENSNFEEKETL